MWNPRTPHPTNQHNSQIVQIRIIHLVNLVQFRKILVLVVIMIWIPGRTHAKSLLLHQHQVHALVRNIFFWQQKSDFVFCILFIIKIYQMRTLKYCFGKNISKQNITLTKYNHKWMISPPTITTNIWSFLPL